MRTTPPGLEMLCVPSLSAADRRSLRPPTQVVCALAVLCYFVVFVLGLVLGLGTGCQWCHYLTCIPTEWWECDGVVTYPNACFITDYNNSTLRLQCPGGQSMLVPAPLEMDHENSVRLCQQQCGFQEVSSTSVIE